MKQLVRRWIVRVLTVIILSGSSLLQARLLFKVHCDTPNGVVDRTLLASKIHLDYIDLLGSFIKALVSQEELAELSRSTAEGKTFCHSEGAFNTDSEDQLSIGVPSILSQTASKNFFQINQNSGPELFTYQQKYIISKQSTFEIDLFELLKEKNPLFDPTGIQLYLQENTVLPIYWEFKSRENKLVFVPEKMNEQITSPDLTVVMVSKMLTQQINLTIHILYR